MQSWQFVKHLRVGTPPALGEESGLDGGGWSAIMGVEGDSRRRCWMVNGLRTEDIDVLCNPWQSFASSGLRWKYGGKGCFYKVAVGARKRSIT